MKNGILNELIAVMKERVPQDKTLPASWRISCSWERKLSIAD